MSAADITMTETEYSTEAFAGQVVTDIAATLSGVLTSLGHKLGLYKAMAGAGPISSVDLAAKTGTEERYVREWLNNQTSGGYVSFDEESRTYTLPDSHVPVLADEESPVFLVPALEVAASLWLDEEKIAALFRTGKGMAWGDHHHRLFCGDRDTRLTSSRPGSSLCRVFERSSKQASASRTWDAVMEPRPSYWPTPFPIRRSSDSMHTKTRSTLLAKGHLKRVSRPIFASRFRGPTNTKKETST